MPGTLALLLAAIIGLLPSSLAAEGRSRAKARSGAVSQAPAPRPWVNRGAPVHRRAYYYPRGYYYHLYYPPAVVVSPYGPTYSYQPRVIEVTTPYFCALHNAGFVTRAGMLDHLAGLHKYPLASAVYFCPDGAAVCVYPAP